MWHLGRLERICRWINHKRQGRGAGVVRRATLSISQILPTRLREKNNPQRLDVSIPSQPDRCRSWLMRLHVERRYASRCHVVPHWLLFISMTWRRYDHIVRELLMSSFIIKLFGKIIDFGHLLEF